MEGVHARSLVVPRPQAPGLIHFRSAVRVPGFRPGSSDSSFPTPDSEAVVRVSVSAAGADRSYPHLGFEKVFTMPLALTLKCSVT